MITKLNGLQQKNVRPVNFDIIRLMEEPIGVDMKEYDIYMKFGGKEKRLLTRAKLKSVPIKRNEHTSLFNLLEGIKIGTAFAPKNYVGVDFIYEEV